MNNETSEILATKTIMVLFEKNSTETQMENVKALLNLFVNEKKLRNDQIVLAKVLENAILLKSAKIMEKGFPLVYFIQSRKFLGFHETNSSISKLNEFINIQNNKDAIEGLRSYFRGCEIIDNPNLVEAMRVINLDEEKKNQEDNLEVGIGSKLIENTLWSVKWKMDSAWNLFANYTGYSTNIDQKKLNEEEGSEDDFIDITVLRQNWYGRTQKRIFRFHNDYFERVDPEGSKTGGEIVKATYKYSDVSKVTVENSTDVAIYFRDTRLATLWIHTPNDANRIISLLCSRAPWTASVTVVRNLEVKMISHFVHTVQFVLPSKVVSYPRWSKDSLFLAYQDEIGWKTIDLERISIQSSEWWAHDLVHFPELFVKGTIVTPLGKAFNMNIKIVTDEELEKNFYDYTTNIISYADAKGTRVQHSGIVAEMVDATGSNCSLFVSKGGDFSTQWKLQHQKLKILDNKCGAPIPSPDGKFVAFVEDITQSIIIHKVDFLTQSIMTQYESSNVDLEEVLYDVRKLPPTKVLAFDVGNIMTFHFVEKGSK